MSAMDDMLANMLKKALPPEVIELLSAEKINELGERINAYIVDTKERLTNVEQQNERIIASMKLLLERSNNVGNKDQLGGRKPPRGNGSAIGSLSGDSGGGN